MGNKTVVRAEEKKNIILRTKANFYFLNYYSPINLWKNRLLDLFSYKIFGILIELERIPYPAQRSGHEEKLSANLDTAFKLLQGSTGQKHSGFSRFE